MTREELEAVAFYLGRKDKCPPWHAGWVAMWERGRELYLAAPNNVETDPYRLGIKGMEVAK